ncbi:MAG: PQQ-dependent sugar dehydrogenase [Chloroflexi bacterium]|nr:PQQ-dependent sugar dehydrogenase [Chloroflexota bacterium]
MAFIALPLLFLISDSTDRVQAQQPELERCPDRSTVIHGELFADNKRWCVESILHDRQIEPYSFTAMDIAPDGTLYATRPLSGAVMAIRDSDGDDLPDKMTIFAEELTLPMGLAHHDKHLYVAGGAHIYRIAESGAVDTIVDDLPSGSGYWTGGITVGDDSRLYLALGAPCDNCEFDQRERGAIISMNLDGSDRRVIATGFRQPADVAFYRGQLWTLDSAPRQTERKALDELNLVAPGGWYGFPYCLGAGRGNISAADIDCADAIAPVMLFGSGANPVSLAPFSHNTLPGTEDTLIVVLSGEPSQIDIVGYKVIMITFDEANQPLGATILIPYRKLNLRQAYTPYSAEGLFWEKYIWLSELGFGIYPQQPLAVAVHPQGWIFISITGGRIIALRPRSLSADYAELYPLWTPMNPDFDPKAPVSIAERQ